jgi:hypothetical protein
MRERSSLHLICDRCGRDNGPVSAVRRQKLGYIPDPCSCGHALFRLLDADERADRERAEARADERQLSLFA